MNMPSMQRQGGSWADTQYMPPRQDAITPPGAELYNATQVPALRATPSSSQGQCNSYLPNSSTLTRFNYIVDFLAANNLYVVRAPALLILTRICSPCLYLTENENIDEPAQPGTRAQNCSCLLSFFVGPHGLTQHLASHTRQFSHLVVSDEL